MGFGGLVKKAVGRSVKISGAVAGVRGGRRAKSQEELAVGRKRNQPLFLLAKKRFGSRAQGNLKRRNGAQSPIGFRKS